MSVEPIRVLCIAGLGRSGSTLLERTLDGLPGAVAVGELTHLWKRGLGADEKCGCGKPFSECEFWRQVGQVAYGGWVNVDQDRVAAAFAKVERTRYIPRLVTGSSAGTFGAQLAALHRLLTRLYRAIAEVSGSALIVDSSKDPSYAYVLRGIEALDLRVVHAIRDAPAVAYSWGKVVVRPEAPETEMRRWSPRTTALWWSIQNVMADGLRLTGVPSCRVRYEDFVTDPAAALRRVGELAGVAPDPDQLDRLADWQVELVANHSVSGNPLRFQTGVVTIRRDEAWRSAMPSRDVRLVETLTLPVRARFGYLTR